MSVADQLSALVGQRDQLADKVALFGKALPDNPTFRQINDALVGLLKESVPAYAAVYTDWSGEYALVFGRLSDGESIPAAHPSEFAEGTSLSSYSSYTGFEDLQPASADEVPWASDRAVITSITFLEGVHPASAAWWFHGMSCVSKVTGLEKLDLGGASSTAYMLSGLEYVTELDLTGFDTRGVSDMTGMFDGMTRLESVTVGESFSFTGDGSTSCALPGESWRAASDGSVYSASAIPAGVADAYSKMPASYAAVYTDYDGEYALVMGKALSVPESYTTDDGALLFLKSGASWEGIEGGAYASSAEVPWHDAYASSITRVAVVDEMAPVSTALWFYGMASCTSIDVSLLDVSKTRNMRGMFANCSSVATIGGSLSEWQTGACENMAYLFMGASSLASVGPLDDWDVSQVKDLTGAFANCTSLTSAGDLSGWQTGSCTSMQALFNGCSKLEALGDLSGWNVSRVEDMSHMFSKCSYLSTLGDISNWRTGACKTMLSVFNGCTALVTLDLSGWDVGACQTMQTMFTGAVKLVSVGDLSGWQTRSCTSMRGMFESCPSLHAVDIGSWDVSQVTDLGWLFHQCYSLVSAGDLSGWQTGSCTNLKNAFYEAFELTSLGDLSGWDVSKITSFAYAFGGYEGTMKLATLGDVSGWNTSSATDMTGTFQNCPSLSANCSKWNVANVTSYTGFNYNASGVTAPSFAA